MKRKQQKQQDAGIQFVNTLNAIKRPMGNTKFVATVKPSNIGYTLIGLETEEEERPGFDDEINYLG